MRRSFEDDSPILGDKNPHLASHIDELGVVESPSIFAYGEPSGADAVKFSIFPEGELASMPAARRALFMEIVSQPDLTTDELRAAVVVESIRTAMTPSDR